MKPTAERVLTLRHAVLLKQVMRTFGRTPAARAAFVLPDRRGEGATVYAFDLKPTGA